jgi:hypothetical protein
VHLFILLVSLTSAVEYDQGKTYLFNNSGNKLESETLANRFLTFDVTYNKVFREVPAVAVTFITLKILNKTATKRGVIMEITSKT